MYITINDINIYYEKFGSGKTDILIIPGWGDNRRSFNNIINLLKNWFNVYIIDLFGFGKSSFPNRDLNIYEYAQVIKDFMSVVGIDNPILIGHSFGGRIIICLTGYLKINCQKILLFNPAGIIGRKSIKSYIKAFIYKVLKQISIIIPKKYKTAYIEFLISKFASIDYQNLNVKMRKTFSNIVNEDLTYLLENINCETLLIWGDKDIDTPLEDGLKMKRLIPFNELIVLKGKHHFTYLEDPYLINKILFEYIKEDI